VRIIAPPKWHIMNGLATFLMDTTLELASAAGQGVGISENAPKCTVSDSTVAAQSEDVDAPSGHSPESHF
jgi:hypothetical protein